MRTSEKIIFIECHWEHCLREKNFFYILNVVKNSRIHIYLSSVVCLFAINSNWMPIGAHKYPYLIYYNSYTFSARRSFKLNLLLGSASELIVWPCGPAILITAIYLHICVCEQYSCEFNYMVQALMIVTVTVANKITMATLY